MGHVTCAFFRICSQNAFAAYPFSCLTAFQLTKPIVEQYNAINLWGRFFLFVNHPAASGEISEAYRRSFDVVVFFKDNDSWHHPSCAQPSR